MKMGTFLRFNKSHVTVLLSTVILSACDFYGGVYREYRLDETPVSSCVQSSLAQVAGVTDATYEPTEVNGRPVDRFTYHAEGVKLYIDIEQKRARPGYIHYYRVFNTVPSEDLVARLRPVMQRVDLALETHCHLEGLAQGAEESCSRGPFRATDCAQ